MKLSFIFLIITLISSCGVKSPPLPPLPVSPEGTPTETVDPSPTPKPTPKPLKKVKKKGK